MATVGIHPYSQGATKLRIGGLAAVCALASCAAMLSAPFAQAEWLPPVEISETAENAGRPHVALDSEGNATAVWDRWDGTATVVERKDYIADTATGRTQMMQLFANRKHVPPANVSDYQPFGAVVGLKSGGSWTFYLQKCGVFSYRTQAQGPLLDAMMVIDARECWPGGAGVFRMI